jgi:predicted MFS family arabinose efflux permease
MNKVNSRILPVIVTAQFFCTSLWFAGNVVFPDLVSNFNIAKSTAGHIIAAVQFGFITGTLVYSIFMVADRFRPSVVFFCSAILAALSNVLITCFESNINLLLLLRFLTGFFLAGIYPVGMKIAADHFEKGLGKALGFLVGALVVGTALPHLLKSFTSHLPWKTVLFFTSGLSVAGGILMLLFVPSKSAGTTGATINYLAVFKNFKSKPFLKAASGYFGHMWELYAFWAFVPFILLTYQNLHPNELTDISRLAFYVIAAGGLACVAAGYFSKIFTVRKTAFTALLLSGVCCLVSPLAFQLPVIPFLGFLVFWGLVVIADSPLFSTMVAQYAVAQVKGTAITFVTCIGFSITIASIELLNYLSTHFNPQYIFMVLAIGPVAGLLFMLPIQSKTTK